MTETHKYQRQNKHENESEEENLYESNHNLTLRACICGFFLLCIYQVVISCFGMAWFLEEDPDPLFRLSEIRYLESVSFYLHVFAVLVTTGHAAIYRWDFLSRDLDPESDRLLRAMNNLLLDCWMNFFVSGTAALFLQVAVDKGDHEWRAIYLSTAFAFVPFPGIYAAWCLVKTLARDYHFRKVRPKGNEMKLI